MDPDNVLQGVNVVLITVSNMGQISSYFKLYVSLEYMR